MSANRLRAIELAALCLAPVAAYFAFGICLINQDNYVDPWFYIGYAKNWQHMFEIFGWTYYSVRFTALAPMELAYDIAGPVGGFALLRYVLAVACVGSVYVMSSRVHGRAVALVAATFLLATPLLARILLWDHPSFMAVALALTGSAVWLTPTSRTGLRNAASGFLLAGAVFSHFFVVTAVGLFAAIQIVSDLRTSGLRRTAVEVLQFALGAVLCLACGIAFYSARTGHLEVMDIIEPTLRAVPAGAGFGNAAPHASLLGLFSAQLTLGIVPLIVVMSLILCPRCLLVPTHDGRVITFALLYSGFMAGFHLLAGFKLLEYWFYETYIFLPIYLLVPTAVSQLVLRGNGRLNRRMIAGVCFVCLIGMALAHNLWPAPFDALPVRIDAAYGKVILVSFAICIVLLLTLLARSVPAFALLACAGLALAVQSTSLMDPAHATVFSSPRRDKETATYLAGVQVMNLMRRYDRADTRVHMWIPKGDLSLAGISFVELGSMVSPPFNATRGIPEIGDFERATLDNRTTGYVLLAAQKREQIDEGSEALRAANYSFDEVETGDLGEPPFTVHSKMLKLRRSGG